MTTATLEPLISSRIRRTLLEHLLAHPDERVYLRGLARALNLPVSPTRRELKRLEACGFLKAFQEANILFYSVNRTSPVFFQLTAALRSSPVTTQEVSDTFRPVKCQTLPVPVRRAFSWKLAMEGVALGLIVTGVLAGVQLLRLITKAVLEPKTQVTVVESPRAESASGVMRGSRWQLVPGGLGGATESY